MFWAFCWKNKHIRTAGISMRQIRLKRFTIVREHVFVCLCAQTFLWHWQYTEAMPLLGINSFSWARMFLQHNSTIVFNVWFSFWHTYGIYKCTNPASFFKHTVPVYDGRTYNKSSFPWTPWDQTVRTLSKTSRQDHCTAYMQTTLQWKRETNSTSQINHTNRLSLTFL